MVKLNSAVWELSTCTCAPWFKHFNCHHVIVCAYRAGLCNFTSVKMQLPLERKLTRGKPSKRKGALVRQSIDPPQRFTGLEYVDDHEDEEQQQPNCLRRGHSKLSETDHLKERKRKKQHLNNKHKRNQWLNQQRKNKKLTQQPFESLHVQQKNENNFLLSLLFFSLYEILFL